MSYKASMVEDEDLVYLRENTITHDDFGSTFQTTITHPGENCIKLVVNGFFEFNEPYQERIKSETNSLLSKYMY